MANSLTGAVESKYNDVQYYFQLKKTNKSLAQENARLKQALAVLLKDDDTSSNLIHSQVDTLFKDSLGRVPKYLFTEAKVVNNSISLENNFITISKGSNDGVKVNYAVAAPNGIAGRVIAVSAHYSVIMSLLNHFSKVSVMLKKSKATGIVEWDGSNAHFLTLRNISKDEKVRKGDSIITSNISGTFPPGLMVGTVEKITKDPSTSFLTITLRSSVDFGSLQYVYLIQNTTYTEQVKVEQVAAALEHPEKK